MDFGRSPEGGENKQKNKKTLIRPFKLSVPLTYDSSLESYDFTCCDFKSYDAK